MDLTTKTRKLQALQAHDLQVVELKQGERGIAALCQIGASYDDFATETLANARRGLEKLRPEEYPERSEIVPVPNAMGDGAERKARFVR